MSLFNLVGGLGSASLITGGGFLLDGACMRKARPVEVRLVSWVQCIMVSAIIHCPLPDVIGLFDNLQIVDKVLAAIDQDAGEKVLQAK